MKHLLTNFLTVSTFFLFIVSVQAQVVWGTANSRTETRTNAGLSGADGAASGFFEAHNPDNYPFADNSWWHLIDVRHSSSANNYALQIAGSFYNQDLYFRKTNDNPLTAWSRFISEKDGKVGIGTTSPTVALDVSGRFLLRAITGGVAANISNLNDQDLQIALSAPGASDKYALVGPSTPTNLAFGTEGQEKARLTNAGDFGIGTSVPQATLDVNGSGGGDINMKVNGRIQTGDANNSGGVWLNTANSQFIGQLTTNAMGIWNGDWRMVVDNNGYVGIGTITPQAKLDVDGNIFTSGKIAIGTQDLTKMGAYALAVNGDAMFQRVRVKLYNTWPDYVFDPEYALPSLQQIEQYIKKFKHLPGVPSATEVANSGLDLGDNQAILLKKLEELTLYVIDLNRKAETQQKEINLLKKKLKN